MVCKLYFDCTSFSAPKLQDNIKITCHNYKHNNNKCRQAVNKKVARRN